MPPTPPISPLTPTVPTSDPTPPASPRVFEVGNVTIQPAEDCYPIESIFAGNRAKTKFKDFVDNAQYHFAVFLNEDEMFVVRKSPDGTLSRMSQPGLKCCKNIKDLWNLNNLKQHGQNIFIILPADFQVEFGFDSNDCFAKISELKLGVVPKYAVGSGWVTFDEFKNYLHRKAIIINKDLEMKLCVWDPDVEQIFALPVQHQLTPQDIFTGLTATQTTSNQGSLADGKEVETVTLGGVCYVVNRENLGSVLTEDVSNANVIFDLNVRKASIERKYGIDKTALLDRLTKTQVADGIELSRIIAIINRYYDDFQDRFGKIVDEKSYLDSGIVDLFRQVRIDLYAILRGELEGIDPELAKRYKDLVLKSSQGFTAQTELELTIDVVNDVVRVQENIEKEEVRKRKETQETLIKQGFRDIYALKLDDIPEVKGLKEIIDNYKTKLEEILNRPSYQITYSDLDDNAERLRKKFMGLINYKSATYPDIDGFRKFFAQGLRLKSFSPYIKELAEFLAKNNAK